MKRHLPFSIKPHLLYLTAMSVGILTYAFLANFKIRYQEQEKITLRSLKGTDLVLRSRSPIPVALQKEIQNFLLTSNPPITHFSTGEKVSFFSMIQMGKHLRLSNIQGYSKNFYIPESPLTSLHNQLMTSPDTLFTSIDVINRFSLKNGGVVKLGNKDFKVMQTDYLSADKNAPTLTDLGASLAPKWFLNLKDAMSLGLLSKGSIATYEMSLNFSNSHLVQIEELKQGLEQKLTQMGHPEISLSTYLDQEGGTNRLLTLSDDLISIITLISVFCAIMSGAYLLVHQFNSTESTRILLFQLGLTPRQIFFDEIRNHLIILLCTFFICGGVLAFFTPIKMLVSVFFLLLFPLLMVSFLFYQRILMLGQQPKSEKSKLHLLGILLTLISFWGFVFWQVPSVTLTTAFMVFTSLAATLFSVFFYSFFKSNLKMSFRCSAFSRLFLYFSLLTNFRRWLVSFMMSSLTLTLVAALVPHLLGHLIFTEFNTGPEKPRFFFIDIQDYQRDAVMELANINQLELRDWSLMSSSKIKSVNGVPFDQFSQQVQGTLNSREEQIGRRFRNRSANLGAKLDPLDSNSHHPNSLYPLIVETRYASRLKLKKGDELVFSLDSDTISAKISEIRPISWSSMRPNFFLELPREALASVYHHYLATLSKPRNDIDRANQDAFLQMMFNDFPNISVIDVEEVVNGATAFINELRDKLFEVAKINFYCFCVLISILAVPLLREWWRLAPTLFYLGVTKSTLRTALLSGTPTLLLVSLTIAWGTLQLLSLLVGTLVLYMPAKNTLLPWQFLVSLLG